MGELQSALDALAGDDLYPMGAPELLGRTARLIAARNRIDAELARAVRRAELVQAPEHDGLKTMQSWLRRAVEIRDKTCVFTGCGAPSWWSEVHHVLAWMLGGDTSLDNSALLCERHHTHVHHGYRIQRQPDGRWRTWRPDGTEILIPQAA